MAKLETFDESLLELGKVYSRQTLSQSQNLESIQFNQSGVIQFQNCLLFLLTLGESKYQNRFERDQFKMLFQKKKTKDTAVVKRIMNCEPTHFFVRKNEKKNKGPMEYYYVGKAILIDLSEECPLEITWLLNDYSEIKNLSWFQGLN